MNWYEAQKYCQKMAGMQINDNIEDFGSNWISEKRNEEPNYK